MPSKFVGASLGFGLWLTFNQAQMNQSVENQGFSASPVLHYQLQRFIFCARETPFFFFFFCQFALFLLLSPRLQIMAASSAYNTSSLFLSGYFNCIALLVFCINQFSCLFLCSNGQILSSGGSDRRGCSSSQSCSDRGTGNSFALSLLIQKCFKQRI